MVPPPPSDPDFLFSELDGAVARAVASVGSVVFHEYLANGLTRDEALVLTRDWQAGYLKELRGDTARTGSTEDEDRGTQA